MNDTNDILRGGRSLVTAAFLSSLLAAQAGALELPPLPDTPAAVDGIVFAQPFELDEPFRFGWMRDPLDVRSGWVVVLEVRPELVAPRQVAEPVLYVDRLPAWRANTGFLDGRVVAIVPGDVDLHEALAWFGTPELPERLTAEGAAQELDLARRAGLAPLPAEAVAAAMEAGGGPLVLEDFTALSFAVRELVERHAPGEASEAP